MSINFKDKKAKIESAVKKQCKEIGIQADWVLIDGFVNQSLSQESGKVTIGGTILPMVAIVEKESGKVHFFAVNALTGIKDE